MIPPIRSNSTRLVGWLVLMAISAGGTACESPAPANSVSSYESSDDLSSVDPMGGAEAPLPLEEDGDEILPPPPAPVVANAPVTFQRDDAPALTSSPEVQAVAAVPEVIVGDGGSSGDLQPAPSVPANTPGQLQIRVTDAPLPGIEQLLLTITRVDIRNAISGQLHVIAQTSTEIDFLSLRGGLTHALSGLNLPAGKYHQLRFFVSSVVAVMGGKRVTVGLPAGMATSGIRIFGTFEIKPGAACEVLLDFDAARMLWHWGGRIFFRPVIRIRRLVVKPAQIHFEEASNNTLSLLGPAQSVRGRAWLLFRDPQGSLKSARANSDGSFRIDNIKKRFGKGKLIVADRVSIFWRYRAWIDLPVDFNVDSRYPGVLASHLEQLFGTLYRADRKKPSVFLARFQSDAFRFLAANYLTAMGASLPSGFVLPTLPVPYAFALEGPEYDLPGFAAARLPNGDWSGGPTANGCADSRQVFTGSASADAALSAMIARGLPFTGLLAEHYAVCQGENLARVSCSVLGTMARAGSASLPSDALSDAAWVLNSPRGGLVTALLSCLNPSTSLTDVPLPSFPASPPACWFGCANGPLESYVSAATLPNRAAIDAAIPDPGSVISLDALVDLSAAAGIAPLPLWLGYVAHHSASKAHGAPDLNGPAILNRLPAEGTVLGPDHAGVVEVSALSDERTLASATINGAAVTLTRNPDGSVRIGPSSLTLSGGANTLTLVAVDEAGNASTAAWSIVWDLPAPSPSPTPTPTLPPGVDPLCADGAFVPKGSLKVGLSIDSRDGSVSRVVSTLTAASGGVPPTVYTFADVASGRPVAEGITVLVVSRVAIFGSITPSYVAGIRAYLASGGSLLAEFDGAALLFDTFATPTNVVLNFNPAFEIFHGLITGGGSLLPIENSTTFVVDANDPLAHNLPSSIATGLRSAFAVTDYNDAWLHSSFSFTSVGTNGVLPIGTFPAVMSTRCGAGRMTLFTLNYLSSNADTHVRQLTTNALNWLIGL